MNGSVPLPRHISLRGSTLVARFRHPGLGGRVVVRALHLKPNQIEQAQKISDQLAVLIKTPRWHSPDAEPEALAEFPDGAPIFYHFIHSDDEYIDAASSEHILLSEHRDGLHELRFVQLGEAVREYRMEAAEAHEDLRKARTVIAAQKIQLEAVTAERDALQRRLIESQTKLGQPEMSITEAQEQYLTWGRERGGRGGRPWSRVHAQAVERRLGQMLTACQIERVGDLESGLVARVEAALAAMKSFSPKSKSHAATTIRGFCTWLQQRELLAGDPLRNLGTINSETLTERGAMTLDQLKALLAAAPPERKLLWATAATTGLRCSELHALSEKHLLPHGLKLEAGWTKSRKAGVQPVPRQLLQRLRSAVDAGMAEKIYAKRPPTAAHWQPPERPLLFVSRHWERPFAADCKRAGIDDTGLSPHSLRHSYVSLLIEMGVSAKEVQELARHSTPTLTMNVYAHSQPHRLASATEELGASLLG